MNSEDLRRILAMMAQRQQGQGNRLLLSPTQSLHAAPGATVGTGPQLGLGPDMSREEAEERRRKREAGDLKSELEDNAEARGVGDAVSTGLGAAAIGVQAIPGIGQALGLLFGAGAGISKAVTESEYSDEDSIEEHKRKRRAYGLYA